MAAETSLATLSMSVSTGCTARLTGILKPWINMVKSVIRPFAFESLAGYTPLDIKWKPRFGLSADFATGDHDPRDNHFETFNPLFPNGF